MRIIKIKPLAQMPDFDKYNQNDILQLSQRHTAIHNDAVACLDIVKENVVGYVTAMDELINEARYSCSPTDFSDVALKIYRHKF